MGILLLILKTIIIISYTAMAGMTFLIARMSDDNYVVSLLKAILWPLVWVKEHFS